MKTIITKLLMLTAVLSASVNLYAYDFEVDGIYYNVIDFNDLTCKIVPGDKVYTGEIKIPSQITFNDRTFLVTEISDDAFTNSDITSITIPNTIEQINNKAFDECSKLKEFTIEDGENNLGFSSINISFGLETLYLGRNISLEYFNPSGYIYHSSPFGMGNLSKLTISNYVTTIPKNLFYGSCENLKELIIKDSAHQLMVYYSNTSDVSDKDQPIISGCQLETFYLGRDIRTLYSVYEIPAFEGEANKLILSHNVKRIGYECDIYANSIHVPDLSTWCNINFERVASKPFNPNPLLGGNKLYINGNLPINITIPEDVTRIKDSTFSHCYSLESVTIGENVTSIGSYAFNDCSNLKTVTIGENVTSIGSNAFSECINLNTVTIGENVTSIGQYAFRYCSNLKAVTIGENVTSIGSYAFDDCSNLKTVTIGENVTSIGSNAFYNCPQNIEINMLNPIPPAISTSTFENKQYLHATLIVPDCSLEAYKTADGWKNFFNIANTNSVKPDVIKVGANDNNIIINGVGNAVVEVYNLSGQLVYSGTETVINVPSKGIYIVRVSGQTFKVIL